METLNDVIKKGESTYKYKPTSTGIRIIESA